MIRILLTGGTGSFGQAFVKKLFDKMADGALTAHIRILSRDEHKQREMRKLYGNDDRISFYIGDARDKDRVNRVVQDCNWVIHAAALKQAPLGEIEPAEFIKTNVQGSINVLEAAYDAGVHKTLLISTDKAVEPINLYGATKMCAERAFLQMDAMRGFAHRRFACTRYGNVAGTSGSIIPLFLNLCDQPIVQPVPITDPESTRFWITLEQATQFVWDTLNLSPDEFGGKVHIPRLKSVRVTDVAEAICAGRPHRIIGLRPGDKVHEVLNVDGERYCSKDNEFLTVDEIREHVFGKQAVAA